MNSAICVHFVKECLIRYCRALLHLCIHIFFTILTRMNRVLKGKCSHVPVFHHGS